MANNVSVSPAGLVADADRSARYPLLMSWWTVCSAIFYLYLAPTLAVSFGARNAIIGILLAVITFALLAAVLARRAIETGFSADLFSENMFGKTGAAVAALILGLTALYYAIFEGSILAVAVSQVFKSLSYEWACVLVIVFTIPFVLSDRIIKYFERANFVLLPIYLLGVCALVLIAGSKFGWSGQWLALGPPAPSPMGWWNCYAAYMGVGVLVVITTDFARFGRKVDAEFHARFTFGLPFYIVTFLINGLVGMFLVGTVNVEAVSERAIVDACLLVLSGGLGLTFIAATQLRINLANLYVSAFNISSVVERLFGKRPPYISAVLGICVLAAFVMATQGALQYMLVSLQYMGIFICSWIGIVLVHTRVLPDVDDATVRAIHSGNMTAWILSTILAVIISFAPGSANTLAPAISFIAAAVFARTFNWRRRH